MIFFLLNVKNYIKFCHYGFIRPVNDILKQLTFLTSSSVITYRCQKYLTNRITKASPVCHILLSSIILPLYRSVYTFKSSLLRKIVVRSISISRNSKLLQSSHGKTKRLYIYLYTYTHRQLIIKANSILNRSRPEIWPL